MSATDFRELFAELNSLDSNLRHLKKMQTIRNVTKIIGVGFFLYKNVQKDIAQAQSRRGLLLERVAPTASDLLDYLTNKTEGIRNSNDYLAKHIETELLGLLDEFQKGLEYLRRVNYNEHLTSNLLAKISKLQSYIRNYNVEFEKSKLREQLSSLRSDILRAEKELDSLFIGDSYFSERDFYDWKSKWSSLVGEIYKCIRKVDAEANVKGAINRVLTSYNRSAWQEKQAQEKGRAVRLKPVKPFSDLGSTSARHVGLRTLDPSSCSHKNIVEIPIFNVRGEPRRVIYKCKDCGKTIKTTNIGR